MPPPVVWSTPAECVEADRVSAFTGTKLECEWVPGALHFKENLASPPTAC